MSKTPTENPKPFCGTGSGEARASGGSCCFWTPSVSESGRGGIRWIWSQQEWCCCFPGEGLHSCGKRSLPGVPGGLIGPQKPAPNITEEEQVAATVRPSVPVP